MTVVMKQYKRDGTPTGIVVVFDKGVIEGIERSTYSERKITSVGRKFEPRDAWYRRRTDVLRIIGRVPRSKAIELQQRLLEPYPYTTPKEGYWWAFEGLPEVVLPSELWAWSAPLELRSERIFSKDGEEYYSFRTEFRWVRRLGVRVIVQVYDADTGGLPSPPHLCEIYVDGLFVGCTDNNARKEVVVDIGERQFTVTNGWGGYYPTQVTVNITGDTTLRIGISKQT